MRCILRLIDIVIGLYILVVILAVVLGWLINLDVINGQNEVVAQINDVLVQLTEPVFAWVRSFVPLIAGIDFSPLIVILVLALIREIIMRIEGRCAC